jgi:hypothetical protein
MPDEDATLYDMSAQLQLQEANNAQGRFIVRICNKCGAFVSADKCYDHFASHGGSIE